MQLYVFWRISGNPSVTKRLPKAVIWSAAAALWLLFLAGRYEMRHGTGTMAMALTWAGMNWLGMVLLMFVCTLAADAVSGFGVVKHRFVQPVRNAGLAVGLILSGIAMVQGARPPVVQQYQVSIPRLPSELEGKTLVAVSDIHLGLILDADWFDSVVKLINAQQPDMIVLLGDIYDGHGSYKHYLGELDQLQAPLGVWAVLGNHDRYMFPNNNAPRRAFPVRLLRDRWEEVRPGFVLAGVDDLSIKARRGTAAAAVDSALKGRPAGAATIFLSHSPLQAEQAASLGANLMLSGHTHAGQIWPFSWLVERRYPLLAGRYSVNGMTVIVSRGAGTWGPRMRLWYPGEIMRITMRGSTGTIPKEREYDKR